MEFANGLAARGHDVTIFHPEGTPCEWMECVPKVKKYGEALHEEHDVIIYNSAHPADYYLVKRSTARLKVFYVLALYDHWFHKGRIPPYYFFTDMRQALRMIFTMKSLRSGCLKLAVGTEMHHWMKNYLRTDSKILLEGVNRDMFHPVDTKKDPGEVRVLCSGDPRKRKGTKTVEDAVAIAKKSDPRITLDTYHGKGIPQDRMAETYCSADIFADGQWYAGWNNPVAEAMACGLPVVCTDIGGNGDFAFHEETALLVPIKDAEAMAGAILRLAGDAALRERLGRNAHQRMLRFDWDRSTEILEKILEAELAG